MRIAALARRLQERAFELGFEALGIAPLMPSPHSDFLQRWIAAGFAGEMSWMPRTADDRTDVSRLFAWARAAVVVAAPYLPYSGGRSDQAGLLPHVARYAVGRDYHGVLQGRLQALSDFLVSECPEARTRIYVDTGPVLERELAARAALGWIGKSTNLVGAERGSWTVLGVMLTSLELPAGAPLPDRCGTCTACIDACPTGAILEPYLLDSRRCISYLTIELRGAIPAGRRADLGDWLLGCDVCQEVCPWNRKVRPTNDAPLRPGAHLEAHRLEDIVRLDDTLFRHRFRDTPFERPRRRGIVRNALIVAANTTCTPALEAAEGCLRDADPLVRGSAAWALGRAGGERRRLLLQAALPREPDPEVRAEIDAALAGGDPARLEATP